nr:MAG TPA: hypothetical protein [Caudoviricetes sp.]DAX51743.1 MAG TPA: hypothetical protein [Caudoviricetes sp.]
MFSVYITRNIQKISAINIWLLALNSLNLPFVRIKIERKEVCKLKEKRCNR